MATISGLEHQRDVHVSAILWNLRPSVPIKQLNLYPINAITVELLVRDPRCSIATDFGYLCAVSSTVALAEHVSKPPRELLTASCLE